MVVFSKERKYWAKWYDDVEVTTNTVITDEADTCIVEHVVLMKSNGTITRKLTDTMIVKGSYSAKDSEDQEFFRRLAVMRTTEMLKKFERYDLEEI